jgi:hypothetical protein
VYFLTPENTTKMHGTDRQIEAFAEAIRAAERERCIAIVKKWQRNYPSEDGTKDALEELRRSHTDAL